MSLTPIRRALPTGLWPMCHKASIPRRRTGGRALSWTGMAAPTASVLSASWPIGMAMPRWSSSSTTGQVTNSSSTTTCPWLGKGRSRIPRRALGSIPRVVNADAVHGDQLRPEDKW
jgi:hypothetical protein